MTYSQLYLKKRGRVPAIAGFLFIIFIVLMFLKIFSNRAQPSKAVKEKVRRIGITNLSSSSVSIFWQTEQKEIGWLVYGTSPTKMNKIVFDERDTSSKRKPYLNHYVNIRGLEEKTQYFFAIVSNNKLIKNFDNKPFSFNTYSKLQISKKLGYAYGKVVQPNNRPLEEALVILSVDDKVFFSTLTKSTGEWLIPFDYKDIKPTQKIKIEVISEDNQISTVTSPVNKISPLPKTVVIGKNYDFTQEDNVLSAIISEDSSVREKKDFDILYPKEEAIIPGRFPLIKGFGPAGTTIYIIIKSEKTYSTKVKVDNQGFWRLSPPEALNLGENRVILAAKNKEGKDVLIERKFFIIGNEGANVSVLGEATPSATTITPFQQTPTPTETMLLTPTPSPPVSGNKFFLHVIAGISFFVLGLGVILAF